MQKLLFIRRFLKVREADQRIRKPPLYPLSYGRAGVILADAPGGRPVRARFSGPARRPSRRVGRQSLSRADLSNCPGGNVGLSTTSLKKSAPPRRSPRAV